MQHAEFVSQITALWRHCTPVEVPQASALWNAMNRGDLDTTKQVLGAIVRMNMRGLHHHRRQDVDAVADTLLLVMHVLAETRLPDSWGSFVGQLDACTCDAIEQAAMASPDSRRYQYLKISLIAAVN